MVTHNIDNIQNSEQEWKCIGGSEYGGFHPEVINYGDKCEICQRRRLDTEDYQSSNFLQDLFVWFTRNVLPNLYRYRFIILAIIAALFNINSQVSKSKIAKSQNSSSYNQDKLTNVQDKDIDDEGKFGQIQSDLNNYEEELNKLRAELDKYKVSTWIAVPKDDKIIRIDAGNNKVIDWGNLYPNSRGAIYHLQINEDSNLTFQLNNLINNAHVSLEIYKLLPNRSKNPIHRSNQGDLTAFVESGAYILEVCLTSHKPTSYSLNIIRD